MPAFPSEPTDDIAAALTVVESGSPVSEVSRRLLDLFTSGAIEPGTRLPPERQLAVTLGVGRSAVREALAALEILGIVSVKPGSGTYLRGTASDILPTSLSWGLLIGKQNTDDLIELRAGLEIFAARLAAARPESATTMAATLQRMQDASTLTAFARADQEFHDALAAATGNSLLSDQLSIIRSLLQVYENRIVQDDAEARLAFAEHEAILRAIEAGDEDAAAFAMAVHMSSAAARLSS